MNAVNEGNIFRFLTKPCEKETLSKAIMAGLDQHRLLAGEKELLEKTLMGSIKVLTDVLSAASPEAFGRSMRIARYVRHLVAKSKLSSPWRFEVAAMLSQLGCVTLDADLIKSSYLGDHLTPEDRARFGAHPEVARALLANIPRLEPIGWMISQQLVTGIGQGADKLQPNRPDDIVLGAEILKLAVAFDNLRMKGLSDEDAIARLHDRRREFGPGLIEALAEMKRQSAQMELRKILVSDLTTGMILQQEVKTQAGMLVIPKGLEITPALLSKIDNLFRAGLIGRHMMALVPV
jgi:response regulator RpfG family c-di-GMP phosphodiesterase